MDQPFIKPAIVIPIYKRLSSLNRLVDAIMRSQIPNGVPLIFRYHKGCSHQVLQYVQGLDWPFGEKRLVYDANGTGLDDNLLGCMSLAVTYEAVIILEDDVYVAPHFYQYACEAIKHYGNAGNIGMMGLYAYQKEPLTGLPFATLQQNHHSIALQKTITWGQIITKTQWLSYKEWLGTSREYRQFVPPYIQSYKDHYWELAHNAFLVSQNKYCLMPSQAFSTNMHEVGTHQRQPLERNFWQVPLATNSIETFHWPKVEDLDYYDAFFEPTINTLKKFLPDSHPLTEATFSIDFYGNKPLHFLPEENVLTRKMLKMADKSWTDQLQPLAMNVVKKLKGNNILYGPKSAIVQSGILPKRVMAEDYWANSMSVTWRKALFFKLLHFVDRLK